MDITTGKSTGQKACEFEVLLRRMGDITDKEEREREKRERLGGG